MDDVSEKCAECGFVWAEVDLDGIFWRISAGVNRILDAVYGDEASVRPEPERWSSVEYAAHVRDVLLTMRERLVVGLVEDKPSFTPMYRDHRVSLGLYRRDHEATLSDDLPASAEMFTRLLGCIAPADLNREVVYPSPEPRHRTLLWVAQQTLHEVEHHAGDIEQNQAATTS